ncbi:hypothetical protein ADL03_42315 [Nocardia sp. NRRL S-836]|nr:hypothetical protein ADL03_42315 [Nocardia sp. NRRL S-836]
MVDGAIDFGDGSAPFLRLPSPAQITVLGLHPTTDGTLRGPHSVELAGHQLHALAEVAGLRHPATG